MTSDFGLLHGYHGNHGNLGLLQPVKISSSPNESANETVTTSSHCTQ